MFQDGSFKTIKSTSLAWKSRVKRVCKRHSAKCMHCTPNDHIAPNQPCQKAHTAKTSVPPAVSLQSYNTAKAATFSQSFVQQKKLMLTCKWKSASTRAEMKQKSALRSDFLPLPTLKDWFPTRMTGVKRFPFNNFTHCLTLFSKFFSSFPHGTCSLSVSRQYLALDEIYHPFWAAFPNNSTLWKRIT